jgi:hypothetical protein
VYKLVCRWTFGLSHVDLCSQNDVDVIPDEADTFFFPEPSPSSEWDAFEPLSIQNHLLTTSSIIMTLLVCSSLIHVSDITYIDNILRESLRDLFPPSSSSVDASSSGSTSETNARLKGIPVSLQVRNDLWTILTSTGTLCQCFCSRSGRTRSRINRTGDSLVVQIG